MLKPPLAMAQNHNKVLIDKAALAKLRADLKAANRKVASLQAEVDTLRANQLNIGLTDNMSGEVMVSGPGQDCGCPE